jgi:hypothetical protein
MRMRGAVRTFGLGCALLLTRSLSLSSSLAVEARERPHFEACNLTRTARAQCRDCIQPCDSLSELLKLERSVREPLRLTLAAIPDAAAIGTKS